MAEENKKTTEEKENPKVDRDDKVNESPNITIGTEEAKIEQEEILAVKVSWKNPTGRKTNKTVRLTLPKIRLKKGGIVSSAAFMKLAAGKELSEEELAANPALAKENKEKCEAWLTHLAKIGFAHLEQV